jgi:WD40 repeat protein
MKFERLSQIQIDRSPSCLSFQLHTSYIFSGDAAGNIYCHDLNNGTKVATLKCHQHCIVAIGFYQNYLYSFDKLQNLVAWDLDTFQVARIFSLSIQGTSTVEIASFTHNGRYLIFVAHPNRPLYKIDVETGILDREFDWGGFFATHDEGSISSFAISRDDTQLAVGGEDRIYSSIGELSCITTNIHQWCLDDGAEICSYYHEYYRNWPEIPDSFDLAFSPDGREILVYDGAACLDAVPPPESRRLIITDNRSISLYSSGVFDYSPVANLVASASGGYIYLFDLNRDEPIFERQISQAAIQQVLFSQNGEFLAVYSEDLTFEVWQIS